MDVDKFERVRIGGALEVGDRARGEPTDMLLALTVLALLMLGWQVWADWRARRR